MICSDGGLPNILGFVLKLRTFKEARDASIFDPKIMISALLIGFLGLPTFDEKLRCHQVLHQVQLKMEDTSDV